MPATDYEDFDDLVSAQETATDTAGKYFCIDVPDYENTTDSVGSDKQSYLRVGAATTTWASEPGADLAALAYLTGPAGRVSATDGGYTLAEGDNAVSALSSVYEDVTAGDLGDPFIDDQRDRGTGNERPGGAPGHGQATSDRRAASAKLHSNVGWRDHTDGNRISTTRGDKVEVVYGNYKLIVMGRQADPACAHGWEANGDHIQDFADGTMPGASVTAEWVVDTTYGSDADKSKGTWLLVNSTERVYQYDRNAGNFRTQNWGDLIENYTGSENPEAFGTTDDAGTQGHPTYRDEGLGKRDVLAPSTSSIDLPRGNPTIIDRTWATKIDSHTGSKKKPVPDIIEKKWADNILERTWAKSIDTNQGTADEWVGSLNEGVWAETIQSYRVAGFILDMATAGLVIDLFAAPRIVVELAASLQITGAIKVEWSLGWSWDFKNLHNEATAAKNEILGLQNSIRSNSNEIALAKLSIGGARTNITKMATDVEDIKATIVVASSEIARHSVRLGGLHTELKELIFIG